MNFGYEHEIGNTMSFCMIYLKLDKVIGLSRVNMSFVNNENGTPNLPLSQKYIKITGQ